LPGIDLKVRRPTGAKDVSGMPGNTSTWCGWASLPTFNFNEQLRGTAIFVWMPPGGAIPERGNFALSGMSIYTDISVLIKMKSQKIESDCAPIFAARC